jgi:hypothetical protein
MTGIITTVISCFINAFPNKKLIGYSYFEQMKDILPSFLLSVAMFGLVWLVGTALSLYPILEILIQIFIGVAFYLAVSVIFRLKPFFVVLNMAKDFIKKKK